jgi:hypothetical protein
VQVVAAVGHHLVVLDMDQAVVGVGVVPADILLGRYQSLLEKH